MNLSEVRISSHCKYDGCILRLFHCLLSDILFVIIEIFKMSKPLIVVENHFNCHVLTINLYISHLIMNI